MSTASTWIILVTDPAVYSGSPSRVWPVRPARSVLMLLAAAWAAYASDGAVAHPISVRHLAAWCSSEAQVVKAKVLLSRLSLDHRRATPDQLRTLIEDLFALGSYELPAQQRLERVLAQPSPGHSPFVARAALGQRPPPASSLS